MLGVRLTVCLLELNSTALVLPLLLKTRKNKMREGRTVEESVLGC